MSAAFEESRKPEAAPGPSGKETERTERDPPRIREIPLGLIDDFPGHPFKVRMDGDMQQLVESVRERGVLTPVILREKEDGRYETVSGHRRKKACEIAGLRTIKAEVRTMTRDEAVIAMVDSNLQRSEILPSEKAFSYKMRLEAMKRLPGRPAKENGVPLGHDSLMGKSREILAEKSPDSNTQIQRYIRLTELIPPVLELVDEGKIGLRPAVELSYLSREEQEMLLDAMEYAGATPSHAQAIRLREHAENGTLGPHVMERVMNEEKPNQKEKISLRYEEARRYIPPNVPYHKTGEYILKALAFYSEHAERRTGERGSR